MKAADGPSFAFERADTAGGRVLRGRDCVAVIRDCTLYDARFHSNRPPLIGVVVGVPLYWRQYAGHQDPERSAASHAGVYPLAIARDRISLLTVGYNASGSILSICRLKIAFDGRGGRFRYEFEMRLSVAPGRFWSVRHNPQHGEVEFCNLWPEDAFVAGDSRPKRYRACIHHSRDKVVRIPHHHLESRDKDRIAMRNGDEFCWILEDDNLAMRLLQANCSASGKSTGAGRFTVNRKVEAGVCAYMWDAHFGFRVCPGADMAELAGLSTFYAHYELYTLPRPDARRLDAAAVDRKGGAIADVPLYVPGVNSFSESMTDITETSRYRVWPWTHEILEGDAADIRAGRDSRMGFDDRKSIFITHRVRARSRWMVTTLGAAFGEADFTDAASYALTAWVRTRDVQGTVSIGMRFHRRDRGSVFDPDDFETIETRHVTEERGAWRKLELRTGPISPAPDRMHLLLTVRGIGTAHFDTVCFERVPGT